MSSAAVKGSHRRWAPVLEELGLAPPQQRALERRLAAAWEVRKERQPPLFQATFLRRTEAVSLTGAACALNCAHCGAHYLRHMTPWQEFQGRLAPPRGEAAPAPAGAPGPGGGAGDIRPGAPASLLVSGGSDRQGRVPVLKHLAQLQRWREAGFRLNLHLGLVDPQEAQVLAGLDAVVSLDFPGDDETIRQVYGLDKSVADYVAVYEGLRQHMRVVPHVTLGLLAGRWHGERAALARLQELGAREVVFLVFIPTPGTRFAAALPPPVQEVAAFLAEARQALPEARLTLGCMRPPGDYRRKLDSLAVLAGMNQIVQPVRSAVQLAQDQGLRIIGGEECCVF